MEKMKHAMTRKWIAAFLALILLAGLAPAAQAAKKTKDIDAAALSSISPWYYLPDTVPEGLLREISARPVQLYETSYTTKQIEEYATSVTVEFVSGDEALKDAIVTIDREDAGLRPGEYFLCDIIGCRVQDESGQEIGILKAIDELPGGFLYNVEGETQHLIPAVPEFIKKTDADAGVITVHLIEGM